MSERHIYAIKVAHQRADKKFWSTIGTLFYNPARAGFKESVALRFNSLPPIGCECRAFPREDDQVPAGGSERFNLTVKLERDGADKPYYHSVGTAFYNGPNGDFSDNFNILLDSYPLTDEVRGYVAASRDEDSGDGTASHAPRGSR